MAKLTLNDVDSLANTASAKQTINDNYNATEVAMENTLSRDGTSPNAMSADLDMGGNQILNVADPIADTDAVNKRSVGDLVEAFTSEIAETIIEATHRVERFVATSGQQDFPLLESPGTTANMIVSDNGLLLTPDIDYTLVGADLTTAHFTVGRNLGAEVVVRYQQLSPTDSVLRGDLNNTVHGASIVAYTPADTGTLGTVESYLDSLNETGANKGADRIGFIQDTGMVVRTAQDKMRDIVHAEDQGLLGDGTTDETTALQTVLTKAQGKVLMLGYGKTYAINTATGLTIPDNTTLIANGSKFKRLTAKVGAVTDADYNIIIGDNCNIDLFEVEAVGGGADIGGVIVTGSDVRIDKLKVTAGSAGSGSAGGSWNALRIGPNSGSATGVFIGTVETPNWDRPVVVQNIDGGAINFARITTYRRGLYLKDVTNFVVRGGEITGNSPNATGAAGDNGVLIESSTSHGSLHDVRIENVTVEDAGEHSYRIGGSFIARNIWHINCHSKNSGTGNNGANYPPENNGACGFKVLGPTATYASRHQNIHYINCSVEDINATSIANVAARGGKSNFAGFQIAKVFGGTIVNPVVMKRPPDSGTYAETGNSCFNGIEIIGSQKITVINPQIQRPYNSGIYIYDFTDGVNDWGQTDDIEIIGGHVNTPGVAGVEIDCSVITMRRISIQGHLSVNAGQYTMKVAKSGTGAFVNCWASMRSISPSVESFNGLGTDWTITVQGTEVGASACANGSTWQSATAGTIRVRKAGAWSSL